MLNLLTGIALIVVSIISMGVVCRLVDGGAKIMEYGGGKVTDIPTDSAKIVGMCILSTILSISSVFIFFSGIGHIVAAF